ncbi:MAG: ABC transporter ATP-binding protein [Firmicutes bacterium]|nr:ABC transporter ATP-binding protein [Bacillota bacterium]
MIKMLKNMKPGHWMLLLTNISFIMVQVWLDLKIPDYMSDITTMVKSGTAVVSAVLRSGGFMLLCAFASMLVLILSDYLSARLAASFSRMLRRKIFVKVESFSMEEIDRFSIGSLITRSTNDVQQLQNFVSRGLTRIVQAPVIAIIALMKISGRYFQWSVITSIAVAIVLCLVVFMVMYAHPKMRRNQILNDDLNRTMRDNMTGIRVVRAYNAEEFQEARFEEINRTYTVNQRKARHAMALMQPTMTIVNNGLTIAIYCTGAFMIAQSANAAEQLGIFAAMVVFSTYASKLLMAFMSLNMIFNMLPRAMVASERINQILDTQPVLTDGTETEGLPGMEGRVEFRNVCYRYPGTESDALTDISFTAEQGKTTAIIGATGSGKSTLLNLIVRFYDVESGQVLVDGRDVREYTQRALHNKIGLAPQRAILFTGSVASNVAYGDNGKEKTGREAVEEAVAIAQAKDFVERMDKGYDGDISRGGMNVSGGQRQRLSIARAVARKPEIYLFDDTFSALDYRTDKLLRAELKEKTAGVTSIIVAQRIGTIRDADKILVMDEGRIIAEGTHKELMKSCKVYQEIAYTQLSEEDLE